METIYKVIGGGQKVRQNMDLNLPTEVIKVGKSDWVERAKCNGQNSFALPMWATDLETIQGWANEWVDGEVPLIIREEKANI